MKARVLLIAASLLVGACSKQGMVDFAISGAHRPGRAPAQVAPWGGETYRVLAGDLHCHVSPPDHPSHVTRSFEQTVELARSEGLDFAVLTPHVWSRFFESPDLRQLAVAWQRQLEKDIAGQEGATTLFIPGFEYSDASWGHVGLSFADVERVLQDLPVKEAQSHPERFVDAWVRHGGMIVLNHPLQTPLDSMFSESKADLSFRPYTAPGPFPEEINAFRRHAHGLEAFNLTASRLRDRWILHDAEAGLRSVLHLLDQEILVQQRMIAATGGSDSHGSQLRATLFVLARDKSRESIRDAIRSGRTCVRDPLACTLMARPAGGGVGVVAGGSLTGVSSIEVMVQGSDAELIVNSQVVSRSISSTPVRLDVPAQCSVLRARSGQGFSGPIEINCPFASARADGAAQGR
ncbi:MAG: hypothetical protein HY898_15700 [Deltaproteobacteria bacterium]|nr:hypothetical protein [Deltaproteobacteria bacterium]